jgi:hypothetical protein
MSSKKRPETLDLERDLTTTPEDISALRKAHARAPIDLAHYLRTLSRLKFPKKARRHSKTHEGFEPFSL